MNRHAEFLRYMADRKRREETARRRVREWIGNSAAWRWATRTTERDARNEPEDH